MHHEELSLLFMEKLNEEFNGRLDTAISIFKGTYGKPFLSQLVSSQLDMDRMDYLNRDSFFTGVSEGVIGYDRLIKMLTVYNGELVVEEKGLYSVERFLTARRLMYWQVYLHKTVLSAELMLIKTLERAKDLIATGVAVPAPRVLSFFLENRGLQPIDFITRRDELLATFARLDDMDIASAVKEWQFHSDQILAFLAHGLANRQLFRLEFRAEPFDDAYCNHIKERMAAAAHLPQGCEPYFFMMGKETNRNYSTSKNEIRILRKNGTVVPMSQIEDSAIQPRLFTKHYLFYPKNI
ncbi:MAG: phosphohydrolase [Saprospiraceae bacterium]